MIKPKLTRCGLVARVCSRVLLLVLLLDYLHAGVRIFVQPAGTLDCEGSLGHSSGETRAIDIGWAHSLLNMSQ